MIKILFLCFFMLFGFFLKAQNHHSTDKPSVHGMTLMGTETIYASHLPMFHSPHDYQIILELQFSKETQAKYLTEKKNNPQEVLYTLEPEVFVLPTMVHKTKKFKANLYRGHFERGGVKFLENVEVMISKVIYFQKFNINAPKPNILMYILFGNEKEQFMAHQIVSKPDFDENLVVQIKDEQWIKQLKKEKFLLVRFVEKNERKPFSWASAEGKIAVQNYLKTIQFLSHQTLYLEFGDLE
ncbi:MAG: hypothetical protein MUC49_09315 [Raineya sp.]|nr:hypothetical protein [Raineya sp.]